AYEPVGALTRVRRIAQALVLFGGLQVPEAFEYRLARERGDPQTPDGLAAARERVHEVEYQFALAPRVGGVDDRGHVLALEQRLDDVELIQRALLRVIPELVGQDRQVFETPALQTLVVPFGVV